MVGSHPKLKGASYVIHSVRLTIIVLLLLVLTACGEDEELRADLDRTKESLESELSLLRTRMTAVEKDQVTLKNNVPHLREKLDKMLELSESIEGNRFQSHGNAFDIRLIMSTIGSDFSGHRFTDGDKYANQVISNIAHCLAKGSEPLILEDFWISLRYDYLWTVAKSGHYMSHEPLQELEKEICTTVGMTPKPSN